MNCTRYYSGGAQTRQDFEGESPEMGEEGLVNDISSEGGWISTFLITMAKGG